MIKTTSPNATYNIDKLPLEAIGMVYFLFKGEIEDFENVHMVEIKLDDPLKNIEEGNENFLIHSSIDEYHSHAKHLWDENWAVIHKPTFNKIAIVDEERFKILLNKYFETGEAVEAPETNTFHETRKRRR